MMKQKLCCILQVDIWSESCDESDEDTASFSLNRKSRDVPPVCLWSSLPSTERENEGQKLEETYFAHSSTNGNIELNDQHINHLSEIGEHSSLDRGQHQHGARESTHFSHKESFVGEPSPFSLISSTGGQRTVVNGDLHHEDTIGVRAARTSTGVSGYVASWTLNGFRKSLYFSVKEYGHDSAKALALLARKEAMRTGHHPTRDEIVHLYEVGSHHLAEDAVQYTRKDGDNTDESVKGVSFDQDTQSWVAEWMTNGMLAS